MAKFLVLYISKKTAEQQIEDMRKSRETWTNWFKSQGPAIMDAGNPTASQWRLTEKAKQEHTLTTLPDIQSLKQTTLKRLK